LKTPEWIGIFCEVKSEDVSGIVGDRGDPLAEAPPGLVRRLGSAMALSAGFWDQPTPRKGRRKEPLSGFQAAESFQGVAPMSLKIRFNSAYLTGTVLAKVGNPQATTPSERLPDE
jgi:hypothetical protein